MSTRSDIVDSLTLAIKNVMQDESYPVAISKVSAFDLNVTNTAKEDTPLIMIDDRGIEEVLKGYDNFYKKRMDVYLRGFVKVDNTEDLHEQLNKVQAFIEQFIDSDPALGGSVSDFQLIASESHRYDPEDSGTSPMGDVVLLTRIIYFQEVGSP